MWFDASLYSPAANVPKLPKIDPKVCACGTIYDHVLLKQWISNSAPRLPQIVSTVRAFETVDKQIFPKTFENQSRKVWAFETITGQANLRQSFQTYIYIYMYTSWHLQGDLNTYSGCMDVNVCERMHACYRHVYVMHVNAWMRMPQCECIDAMWILFHWFGQEFGIMFKTLFAENC